MNNEILKECSCKKAQKIKLFLATKSWPRQCKECNGYMYVEAHIVEAYVQSSHAVFPAAFLLFALYRWLGLLILLLIPIVFRLVELFIFKVHYISEEEKRAREQPRPVSDAKKIVILVTLLLILMAVLIDNYKD